MAEAPGKVRRLATAAVFACAIAGAMPAVAAPAGQRPMFVAGGDLDPAFPDAEIYRDVPRTPPVPGGRACKVAARYVTLINADDYRGVAALYADDATFLEPMRPSRHGRTEIDAFYTKRIGTMRPAITAVSYQGDDHECMVALALRVAIAGRNRYALVSIDHFIVDGDGKIGSMAAFARPVRGGP